LGHWEWSSTTTIVGDANSFLNEGKPGTHLFIDNPTNQLNHSSALNALCGGNKRRLTSNTHPFTGSA
jgi:hypothetical protein